MSEVFSIKVRLVQDQVELQVHADMCIPELKTLIAANLPISAGEQKLISQGKVLTDSDTISTAKLQPGFVIQVMRAEFRPSEVPIPAPERDPRAETVAFMHQVINSLPPAILMDRGARPRPRRVIPATFKLESIRQNLLTLESLLETRANPWIWTAEEVLFNYRNRRLQRGQWIDVKDTMGVWLEAHVLDVRSFGNSEIVLIHYNEWPVQWDEWIETSSPRIQPFRMFSKQSGDSPVQSPFPVVLTQEVFPQSAVLFDISSYVFQVSQIMDRIQPLFMSYFRLRQGSPAPDSDYSSDFEESSGGDSPRPPTLNLQKLKTGLQLAIILDRLGRALADLGAFGDVRATELHVDQMRLLAMPSQGELRQIAPETEIRISLISAPLPQRRF